MDAPFPVRPATEIDLRYIAEIERLSFSDPWPRSAFLPLLGDCSWSAESDGRVVGYLFGRVAADEAEILNLAVHPEWRRRGIARALLTMSFGYFGSQGVGNVYLEVRAANAGAQTFYRSMGFQERGRRALYYDHPLDDAVIMACPVRAPKSPEKNGP